MKDKRNIIVAIEEYRASKSEAALVSVKDDVDELELEKLEGEKDTCKTLSVVQRYGKAVAFLFTIEEENYKNSLEQFGKQILSMERKNGMLWEEGTDAESMFYQVLPVYALYETKLNKKEHYADIIGLCKKAVEVYPGSELVFAGLAETLEYMSEEIYEQYAALYQLLKQQYKSIVKQTGENTSALVAYALAKGCFYKAFLEEKYSHAISTAWKESEESYCSANKAVCCAEIKQDNSDERMAFEKTWKQAAKYAHERLVQKLYGKGLV